MSDNRHPREPDVSAEEHDGLGFVVNLTDPDCQIETDAIDTLGEDVDPESVRIQIKPHPGGYQLDMWWETAEGERRQTAEHLTFRDRRVELRRKREQMQEEADA